MGARKWWAVLERLADFIRNENTPRKSHWNWMTSWSSRSMKGEECRWTPESKGQTFRGIPGFYSTSGAVDWSAVIFSVHLVAVTWNARFLLLIVLGKYSYSLGQQPSWRVPLLPANRVRVRQSACEDLSESIDPFHLNGLPRCGQRIELLQTRNSEAGCSIPPLASDSCSSQLSSPDISPKTASNNNLW